MLSSTALVGMWLHMRGYWAGESNAHGRQSSQDLQAEKLLHVDHIPITPTDAWLRAEVTGQLITAD